MNKVSLRMRGLLLAALTYSLMGTFLLLAEEGKEPLLSLPQKVNSKLPEFPPAPPDSGLKFPCPTETGKAPESPFFIFRRNGKQCRFLSGIGCKSFYVKIYIYLF